MNYTEIDKICKLDLKKLYKDVQSEQIPYYQWAKWLSSKICRIYMDSIAKARKSKKHPAHVAVEENPNVKKEVVSHHFFSTFNLDFNYFYKQLI